MIPTGRSTEDLYIDHHLLVPPAHLYWETTDRLAVLLPNAPNLLLVEFARFHQVAPEQVVLSVVAFAHHDDDDSRGAYSFWRFSSPYSILGLNNYYGSRL
jgi:hypothetical protein